MQRPPPTSLPLSGPRSHPQVPEVGEKGTARRRGSGVEGVGVSTQALFF